MNIKEVELKVGMSSKNIRFYEEEGLIAIPRNQENGYREFNEANLTQLQEIKMFRNLGISLEDIRKYQKKEMSVKEMMDHRLKELDETRENAKMMREMCTKVRDSDAPLIPFVVEECNKQMASKVESQRIPQMGKRQMKTRIFWGCFPLALIMWMLFSTFIFPMIYQGLASLSVISVETAEAWSTSVFTTTISLVGGIVAAILLSLAYTGNRQQFFELDEHGIYYIDEEHRTSKIRISLALLTGKSRQVFNYLAYEDIYKVEPGLRVVGTTAYTGTKIFEFVFRIGTTHDENFTLCCGLTGEDQSGIDLMCKTLQHHAQVVVDPYHLLEAYKLGSDKYHIYLNKVFNKRLEDNYKKHHLNSLWD